MSMLIKSILVLIIVFSVSCNNEKQQANSTKQETDSTTDISVSEEYTFIDVLENALYQNDFNESIKREDYRFIGVMGYDMIVPGVPDYYEKYSQSCSVKIIKGTTDDYDSVSIKNAVFFREYARNYNNLLLKYLSQNGE